MAGVLTLLDQPRTLNALGNATSAIIYFYNTGTTTLAPIYTNAALTIPAANPVVLSAGQIFPDIYLDPEITYRRRIVYGDGSIHDVDPLPSIDINPEDISFTQTGTGAVSRTLLSKVREVSLSLKDFGAVGDGIVDDTSAWSNAVEAARSQGRELYVPSGTYKITSPTVVRYSNTNFTPTFQTGLKIRGDGINQTIFDYSGDGAFLDIDIDRPTGTRTGTGVQTVFAVPAALSSFTQVYVTINGIPFGNLTVTAGNVTISPAPAGGATITFYPVFRAVMDSEFAHFTVRKSGTPGVNNSGIKLRTCYMTKFNHLSITGLESDGFNIESSITDLDGCTYATFNQVYVDGCKGWGIKGATTGGGATSLSFVKLHQVWVQGCGTASGAYQPPSGGMFWRGLICELDSCGFSLNQNAGLYVPADSPTATRLKIVNTDFENNIARHIFVRGCIGFEMSNGELLSNSVGPCPTMVEFEAGSAVITNVNIKNCVVRGNALGTAQTAFKVSGANYDHQSSRFADMWWLDYDYANNIRFDGVRFEPKAPTGTLGALSGSSIRFSSLETNSGRTVPIKLKGPRGGAVASTTGEVVDFKMTGGVVTSSVTGLANNTIYNVYVRDKGQTIPDAELILSTTAPVATPPDDSGLITMTGDTTAFYLGRWSTDGSGNLITSAAGWLNPARLPHSSSLGYMWTDNAGVVRRSLTLPTSDTGGTAV